MDYIDTLDEGHPETRWTLFAGILDHDFYYYIEQHFDWTERERRL